MKVRRKTQPDLYARQLLEPETIYLIAGSDKGDIGDWVITRGNIPVELLTNREFTDTYEHSSAELNTPEPPPKPSESPPMWELVIKDMQDRDNFGASKYGTRLQAFNGRDPLKDLMQELLDGIVYLRQIMYERDGK